MATPVIDIAEPTTPAVSLTRKLFDIARLKVPVFAPKRKKGQEEPQMEELTLDQSVLNLLRKLAIDLKEPDPDRVQEPKHTTRQAA